MTSASIRAVSWSASWHCPCPTSIRCPPSNSSAAISGPSMPPKPVAS